MFTLLNRMKPLWMVLNMVRFYGEKLLAPRPNPKLEGHPLSAVRDCLFNIFTATLHTGGRSFIRNLRTRHAVVTGSALVNAVMNLRVPWNAVNCLTIWELVSFSGRILLQGVSKQNETMWTAAQRFHILIGLAQQLWRNSVIISEKTNEDKERPAITLYQSSLTNLYIRHKISWLAAWLSAFQEDLHEFIKPLHRS